MKNDFYKIKSIFTQRGDNSFLLKYRNINSKLLKICLKHDIKIHKLYN